MKQNYYFILCGTKEFIEAFKDANICTEKDCLLRVKCNSYLGRKIKRIRKLMKRK